ncbi:MAG: hypothetical protein RR185_05755 [Angelakisella sp.]
MWSKTMSGVQVKHCKNTASSVPVRMPVPDQVVIPMIQHMGAPCQPLVAVNDLVTVGQKIGDTQEFMSAPVHSSVSGKVTELREFITSGGAKCLAVVIATDKQQTLCPDIKPPVVQNHKELLAAVRECGLVGLGGAGFPTHVKLNPKKPKRSGHAGGEWRGVRTVHHLRHAADAQQHRGAAKRHPNRQKAPWPCPCSHWH